MDELNRVRGLRAHPPAPDHAVIAAGRRQLADAIAEDRRTRAGGRYRRRLRRLAGDWRVTALGAATAVALAAVLATQITSETTGQPELPAAGGSGGTAGVLERAAEVVARQPDPPVPAAGQWIYTRSVQSDQPARQRPGTTYQQSLTMPGDGHGEPEHWIPFTLGDGDTRPGTTGALSPYALYEAVAALPEEPLLVVREAREIFPALRKPGDEPGGQFAESPDEHAFRALGEVVASYPLPTASLARVYRALATVPGVVVHEDFVVDAAGRRAIAITRADRADRAATLRSEILIDPRDYRYLGQRTVAGRDAGQDGDGSADRNGGRHADGNGGPETERISEGDVLYSEARIAVAVVDREGQRP
ncbi:CU044_5270 family protein [Streptomyces yaizuensis]|uniref:CU044_5270 family protein n=1 Tax=Streptomyces yaizuensis TaxID=2989713 RepID=A0ABQ5P3N9_9ACTN|nr:CU044_5270 family protein [Streptomyces sp. YSPA8]GLF97226.1 CU044_5270 family protein [Streptomyces sp. YSPA8]